MASNQLVEFQSQAPMTVHSPHLYT